MVGDLANFVSRLRAVLPKRWFRDENPNLSAILTGLAAPWTWLYDLLTYVAHQARVGTATDAWLDLAAVDYFGEDCKRKASETDFFYRARIKKALLRDAATRGAIRTCILETCESEPRIFEPANSSDAGAYGALGREGNCPCSGLA